MEGLGSALVSALVLVLGRRWCWGRCWRRCRCARCRRRCRRWRRRGHGHGCRIGRTITTAAGRRAQGDGQYGARYEYTHVDVPLSFLSRIHVTKTRTTETDKADAGQRATRWVGHRFQPKASARPTPSSICSGFFRNRTVHECADARVCVRWCSHRRRLSPERALVSVLTHVVRVLTHVVRVLTHVHGAAALNTPS